MAVRRSLNILNQQRIDLPHMRSIESAIRNDFDELISSFAVGSSDSYVIRGLELSMVGAVGSSAGSLQLIVENSAFFHGSSATAGTFFEIPDGTDNQTLNSTVNTRVSGAFVPNALNYVGIDFARNVDDTTTTQAYFWNPSTKTEYTKTVPMAQVLDFTIVISSSSFASTVLPISIVATDASNNVLSVTDQRPLLFRLGTAGSITPNPSHDYPWTAGRSENYWKSSGTASPFQGGDKQIQSLKDWTDAIMTEIKAVKGTPYWYNSTPGISIVDLFAESRSKITGRGSFFHSESTAGQVNWDRDFYIKLIGSKLDYRILANLTTSNITLSDGQVAYLEYEREIPIAPSLILSTGSNIVTSVGSVSWTSNVQAGDYIKLVSAGWDKYYKIQSVDTLAQVTLATNYNETSTGTNGLECVYTWGTYYTAASPSSNRHIKIAEKTSIPMQGNVYPLFYRDDNGGPVPKIYIGNSGGELEMGESIQVGDETSEDIISYIGAMSEADSDPSYAGSVDKQEVTKVYFVPQSDLLAGQYWLLSAASGTNYYVWYTFNGAGSDPAVALRTGINVNLSVSGDTENQVAQKTQLAIDALANFVATVSNNCVSIQDANNGTPTDASNVNMGGAFSIKTVTEGDISTKWNQQNYNTVENENLTRRCARLTAMTADKAQDKTIGFLNDYKMAVKATSGANQQLIFGNTDIDGNAITPYLKIGMPSSTYSGYVELLNGPLTLAQNQVAYFRVDRNASFSYDLSTVSISSIAACPLDENTFILAYRLDTTDVWLWDGTQLLEGSNPSSAAVTEMLNKNVYEEFITVVAGLPSGPNEIQAPILAGTIITLPPDSRDGYVPMGYIVGDGILDVSLNGQHLFNGTSDAYQEVGVVGSSSNQIQINIDLVIGDELLIRVDSIGGYVAMNAFGGNGEINIGNNLGIGAQVYKNKTGVTLNFRTLISGNELDITTGTNDITIAAKRPAMSLNNADYVVQNTDGISVFLVTTGGSTRLITLPVSGDNYGRTIVVKKIDGGSGYVRVRASGSEYIDDQQGASYLVDVNEIQSQWNALTFYCDGTGWFLI